MITIGDVVEITLKGKLKGVRFRVRSVGATIAATDIVYESPYVDDDGYIMWFTAENLKRVNTDCNEESPFSFSKLIEVLNNPSEV